MWESRIETLENGRVLKVRLFGDAGPVSYSNVLSLWRDDAAFRTFFSGKLADAPFSAFRWETPPITRATAGRDFEYVLLRYDGLERPVDQSAFASHFDNADGEDVLTFPNLSGDAVMVVPCPSASPSIYGHLGSFLRSAPEGQVHSLWQRVGEAMQEQPAEQPVWLSTAGMGIAWLHIRLDSRPKYYGFAPYRTPPE